MDQQINTFLIEIKRDIDKAIDENLQNDNPLIEALYKSAVYSASGGKRIRAIFLFLISELFDLPQKKILGCAHAIELVHAASLIMDDLPYMDDSQLRRGKPANHVVFGQDVSLLASIGLISEAIEIALKDTHLNSEERNQIISILTNSFGFKGLASGQFVDLKLKKKLTDFEIYRFIIMNKTASLFIAAGNIGASLGHANEKQLAAVKKFSEDIGVAFHLLDEINEFRSAEESLGRNPELDSPNFIQRIGIDKANDLIKEYFDKAILELELFGTKATNLKNFAKHLIERN